jgi:tRNA threonylcarbamoyladenosine biosynthesis protein TsaB
MILLLDTSTAFCKLTLVDGERRYDSSWEAHRELAKGLLGYLEQELQSQEKGFADIAALGGFKGPGSFTGLRIGLTVLNSLADALSVPLVGETGDDWQEKALMRLKRGDNDRIALPLYGSEAHITSPRK